ncbi:g5735 [Coccomyxa viridis]|uniref:G5735 protein n=1 Tax=Coccomyxa viridis TaxID=1274662 RepID=A0ABP1FTM4_9CHLO
MDGYPQNCKAIQPTLITDLEMHQPQKYKGPRDKQLDDLDKGDFIKIAYLNREEVWLYVEHVDERKETLIYAQVAQHVKVVDGLKVNQRVIVLCEHVVEIRFHDEKISP